MKKILGILGVAGIIGASILGAEVVEAYGVNDESGEYVVSFSYNEYLEDGAINKIVRNLRMDVPEDDVIEVGSLLTDLDLTAVSEARPKNPNSESGEYHWKFVGKEDNALETITRADFTDFCKMNEEGEALKCARLEAVFPDAPEEVLEDAAEVVGDGLSLWDEATGVEIAFSRALAGTASLKVAETEAEEVLRGDIPAALKKVFDLRVFDGENEVEVSDNEMTISIPLPEEWGGCKYFQIVYVENGEIAEILPAEVLDGKIVFKTTHLSAYGVEASNKPFTVSAEVASSATGSSTEEPGRGAAEMPNTGAGWFERDGSSSSKVVTLVMVALAVALGVGALVWRKMHAHKIKF